MNNGGVQIWKTAAKASLGGMMIEMYNTAPECPACGNARGTDLGCLTCIYKPSRMAGPFIPKEHPNYP